MCQFQSLHPIAMHHRFRRTPLGKDAPNSCILLSSFSFFCSHTVPTAPPMLSCFDHHIHSVHFLFVSQCNCTEYRSSHICFALASGLPLEPDNDGRSRTCSSRTELRFAELTCNMAVGVMTDHDFCTQLPSYCTALYAVVP